jgi:hypothetical protein
MDVVHIYEALSAAESILRYAPSFSTNCGGTKPGMTTQEALRLVRAALADFAAERVTPIADVHSSQAAE